MPAPTMPLIKLKEAPVTDDLDSAVSLRRRRRRVPPGVMVVVVRMGVWLDGAKKGEELTELEGVDAAVRGVMGRDESTGAPRRDERRLERRPMM